LFKHILTTLDGSKYAERALRYARDFAKTHQSKIHLVAVITPVDAPGGGRDAAFEESRRELWTEYLEARAAELREVGAADVTIETREGEPAAEITDLARDVSADLIVMSTHGLGASGRHALGSVALKVLMTAPCPVLMVRILEVEPPRSRAEERWQDEGGANVG